MGNYVYSVHNSQDGKIYNVLGRGDLPCVVFGRVIKPNSVPGMQYYFTDGRVKWNDGSEKGYSYVKPFPKNEDDKDEEWGVPCIFIIPDDFDYSRISDVEYVKQQSRTAIKLNANTMSPNYIIRYGKLICVKTINEPGSGVVIAKHKYKMPGGFRNFKITHGKRLREIHKINNRLENRGRNKFILIPVGRVRYKRSVGSDITFYRYKQSIYHYNVRKIVKNSEGGRRFWKYKVL